MTSNRLFEIFDKEYTDICGLFAGDEARIAVRHILQHNILCGDALTLKTSDGQPIAFAEWSAVNSCLLKRRDFRLDQMLEGREQQYSLDMSDWIFDEEVKAYIPLPFREFPPVHYRKVHQHE